MGMLHEISGDGPSRFRRFGQACAKALITKSTPDVDYNTDTTSDGSLSPRTIPPPASTDSSSTDKSMKEFRFWPNNITTSTTRDSHRPMVKSGSRPQTSISTSLSPTTPPFDERGVFLNRPHLLRRATSSSNLASPTVSYTNPSTGIIRSRSVGGLTIANMATSDSASPSSSQYYSTHGQDAFAAFYASTKPRAASQDITAQMLRKQKQEAQFAQQMAKGAYLSISESEEEETTPDQTDIIVTDSDNTRRSILWTLDDDTFEDDGRWNIEMEPPLTPDFGNSRESSISEASSSGMTRSSTPPTPSISDLDAYRARYTLVLSDSNRSKSVSSRRRTASSECISIMEDTAKELRTMMLSDDGNEFAVEDEDVVDTRLTFLADGTSSWVS